MSLCRYQNVATKLKAASMEKSSVNYIRQHLLRIKDIIWHYGYLAIPVLVVVGCYINSVNGEFVHDDLVAIVRNKDVLDDGSADLLLHDFWGDEISRNTSHKSYRPVTVWTFRWNAWFAGGLHPYGFHVVNILLHAVVTLLFTQLCYKWVFIHKMHLSALAGVLFASHPIHTEAVAGIVGRADMLAAVFFLLMLRDFLSHINTSSNQLFPSGLFKWLLYSSLALLSKETGVTVLPVCILLDLFIHMHLIYKYLYLERNGKQIVLTVFIRITTLCVLGGLFLLLRLWIMGGTPPIFMEQDNPAAFHESLQTRFLSRLHIYAVNVWLLMYPSMLSYDWQMNSIELVTHLSDSRNVTSILLFSALLILATKCLGKHKPSESERSIFFGLVLLIIPFIPASNLFITVGFVIAERILYIPSMGAIILVVLSIEHLSRRLPNQRRSIALFAIFLCIMFSIRTVARNRVWHNRESLFRSGLESVPHNAKVQYNYANFLKDTGQKLEAIQYYKETIRLWPGHASAHNNLGTLLSDPVDAHYHYDMAIHINPQHANAHFNKGNLQHQQGNSSEALQSLQHAYDLDPTCSQCLLNIAAILAQLGQVDKASLFYRKAFNLEPNDANILNNYAVFLEQTGDYNSALRMLKSIYTKDPSHYISMQNAARILHHYGRIAEAKTLYLKVSSLTSNPEALDQTGVFFFNNGDKSLAVQLFSQAVEQRASDWQMVHHYVQALNALHEYQQATKALMDFLHYFPDHIQAQKNLASVLGHTGKHKKAISHLHHAIQCTDNTDVLADLHLALGKHHRDLQLMDEALYNYQYAAQVNPSLAEAQHNLAVMYHIKGNFSQAKHHYSEAVRLEPRNELLQQNLVKLERAMMQNMLPERTQYSQP